MDVGMFKKLFQLVLGMKISSEKTDESIEPINFKNIKKIYQKN